MGKSLSLFKECYPPDIFGLMWKKGLGHVFSDGMAGMRNGNCFAFYTVFGKGNKNTKEHQCWSAFLVSELKGAITKENLRGHIYPRIANRVASQISQVLCALSHDFGVPTSICKNHSEERATFPGTAQGPGLLQ